MAPSPVDDVLRIIAVAGERLRTSIDDAAAVQALGDAARVSSALDGVGERTGDDVPLPLPPLPLPRVPGLLPAGRGRCGTPVGVVTLIVGLLGVKLVLGPRLPRGDPRAVPRPPLCGEPRAPLGDAAPLPRPLPRPGGGLCG
mmetsp:Transcript_3136/g.10966  ORF Transcript_3136/g.10966 Transcript_3136/m.10966 type:complete len:142 (+) Transcript_3136:1603-2028(+)